MQYFSLHAKAAASDVGHDPLTHLIELDFVFN